MDEKENAQKPTDSAPAAAPPPTAPPIDPPPPTTQDAAPEREERREKMSTSDWIMSIATVVIALGTIVSAVAIFLQWREMVNGGTDTTAIKIAAQQQATAAQKFADTAVLINSGIADAVTKLQFQSDKMEATRKTSEAASHLEQRPWLGFKQITCDNCFFRNAGDLNHPRPVLDISRFGAILVNTGKTPAKSVEVHFARVEGTTANMRQMTTEELNHPFDPRFVQIISTTYGPRLQPTPLLGPGIEAPILFVRGGGYDPNKWPRFSAVYVKGTIKYQDLWNEWHRTDFCVFVRDRDSIFVEIETEGYAYCEAPNSNVMY